MTSYVQNDLQSSNLDKNNRKIMTLANFKSNFHADYLKFLKKLRLHI